MAGWMTLRGNGVICRLRGHRWGEWSPSVSPASGWQHLPPAERPNPPVEMTRECARCWAVDSRETIRSWSGNR